MSLDAVGSSSVQRDGVRPASLASQFDDLDQQHDAARLGMWVFLGTEALLFGGMFVSYAMYRYWYPIDFDAGSRHLNVLIGAINTIVLLTSSLTMALAVRAAGLGKRSTVILCLGLTAALGAAFLLFKAFEYYTDYREYLIPGTSRFRPEEWSTLNPPVTPGHVALFLLLYYIMTGVHALHLTIGIGLLAWLLVQAVRGRLVAERSVVVEVIGLYWHFVDLIWILLLPLLYLVGVHTPADLHF